MTEPTFGSVLDEAIDESFPASDPPAMSGLHAGHPSRAPVRGGSSAATMVLLATGGAAMAALAVWAVARWAR